MIAILIIVAQEISSQHIQRLREKKKKKYKFKCKPFNSDQQKEKERKKIENKEIERCEKNNNQT